MQNSKYDSLCRNNVSYIKLNLAAKLFHNNKVISRSFKLYYHYSNFAKFSWNWIILGKKTKYILGLRFP